MKKVRHEVVGRREEGRGPSALGLVFGAGDPNPIG